MGTRAKNLDYALRRVMYNTLIAARAMVELRRGNPDFALEESAKVAALILARNVNAFLYQKTGSHDDDVSLKDFKLKWCPGKAKLSKETEKRLHKTIGHIVAIKTTPFNRVPEVEAIVTPLLRESAEFIRQCVAEGKGKYTGKAKDYERDLDKLLPELGLFPLNQTSD